MEIFVLPSSTKVSKVIPKNAFDAYTNTKQKKLFTEKISRITWVNKISKETINLDGVEIHEIQVFLIELKTEGDITSILDIIDKAIPYPIIFVVASGDKFFLSTSLKHPNPLNENNSVIDSRFKTEWLQLSENMFSLQLKKSLDWVYIDFCKQLSPAPDKVHNLKNLVHYNRELQNLEKDLKKIKSELGRAKQFNLKVELNLKIKALEDMILKHRQE